MTLQQGQCHCWNGVKKLPFENPEQYKMCAQCSKPICPQRTTWKTSGAYHYNGLHFHADRACLIEYPVKVNAQALGLIMSLTGSINRDENPELFKRADSFLNEFKERS